MLEAREATWQLAQELGRTPAESDMARHLGVSADELRHARRAELALQPSSLDAPLAGQPGTGTLADCLGEQDPRIEHMLGMHAVAAHWGELPPREQEILLMDFNGSMTQAEIGRRLGISQMHVSRLRTRALGHLRSRLLDLEEAHPDTGPAAPGQPPRVACQPGERPARHYDAYSAGGAWLQIRPLIPVPGEPGMPGA